MGTEDIEMKREASYTFLAKMVMGLFGFSGVIIFAWYLGAAGLGQYYFGLAFALLLAKLSAGVGTAVKKRTSESESQPNVLLWSGLAIHSGFAVLGALFLLILSPVIASRLGGLHNLGAVAGIFVSTGAFYIIKNSYEGRGYPARGVWADAIETVVVFTLQVGALWVGESVFGLFLGKLLGSLLCVLGLYALTGLSFPGLAALDIHRVGSFARWSVPHLAFEDLFERIDVIIITLVLGASPAGVYEAAKRLTMPGMMASLSISEPLIVKVSGLTSIGRDDEVYENIRQGVGYAGVLSIPLIFGAVALGDPIMTTLYGAEFAGAGSVLVVIALAQLFNAYRSPFKSMIDGSNRPRDNLTANSLAVGINAVGTLLLIGPLGVLGAVTATFIAEVFRFAFYQWLVRQTVDAYILPVEWSWQLMSGVIMYGALLVALSVELLNPWQPLHLGVLISIGGLMYLSGIISADKNAQTVLSRALNLS